MAKIKICLLPQNASWIGTLNLDTAISVVPSFFFGQLLLEQINFSHPVTFPLNNSQNVKPVSMQKQRTRLFKERKHILTSLMKDISMTIISALVLVCLWIILSPD